VAELMPASLRMAAASTHYIPDFVPLARQNPLNMAGNISRQTLSASDPDS
jgi:hypothetical protein